MTPDDVIVEAIATASLTGDTPQLRQQMCEKLAQVIRECDATEARYRTETTAASCSLG